jgi:hypothetical protein
VNLSQKDDERPAAPDGYPEGRAQYYFSPRGNRSLPNRGTIAAIRTALSRRLQVPRESPWRLFETQIWQFRQVVCRVKV